MATGYQSVAKKIYLISKKIVSIITIVDPKDRFVTRENLTFGLVRLEVSDD